MFTSYVCCRSCRLVRNTHIALQCPCGYRPKRLLPIEARGLSARIYPKKGSCKYCGGLAYPTWTVCRTCESKNAQARYKVVTSNISKYKHA